MNTITAAGRCLVDCLGLTFGEPFNRQPDQSRHIAAGQFLRQPDDAFPFVRRASTPDNFVRWFLGPRRTPKRYFIFDHHPHHPKKMSPPV